MKKVDRCELVQPLAGHVTILERRETYTAGRNTKCWRCENGISHISQEDRIG